ncbi:MAG: site-specific DNA-methyltransferase [Syntrophomonas sp.]|nr:site-specific DNA-methyltransferase [Syntrophomonas sp.]
MGNYRSARLVWDSKIEEMQQPISSIQAIQRMTVNPIFENQGYYEQLEVPVLGDEKIENIFYYGDNYDLLNYIVKAEPEKKIDLIYIDPPYMTELDYHSSISIGAYSDIKYIKRTAFQDRWPRGLDSYLDMMYTRLQLMKKVLSNEGSIFVHVDWHVSHYLRVLLDEIFGPDNFINEIAWCFGGGSSSRRYFHRKHDLILWYARSPEYIYNPQYRPYTQGTIKRGLTNVKGDRYKLHEEGALMQDWWVDINKILSPTAYENLKFPTQKPKELLARLIAAASRPGSLVADFFAGSGTLAEVCNEMGRNWVLADASSLALQTSCYRLIRSRSKPFKIIGANNGEDAPGCELVLKQPLLKPVDDNDTLVDLGIDFYWPAQLPAQGDRRDFADYIEFWEIDLDFQEHIFNSHYQVLRNKQRFKEPIALDLLIRLESGQDIKIAIKVWDVWANQTISVIPIKT